MKLIEAAKLTERDAREYLESIRWPDGPVCPQCGNCGEIYELSGDFHRDGFYKCAECRTQLTVMVGTVLHRQEGRQYEAVGAQPGPGLLPDGVAHSAPGSRRHEGGAAGVDA